MSKNIFSSKIVWTAFLSLITAIVLYQFSIEIPSDATTELAGALSDAIRAKDYAAMALAVFAFFTGTFRVFFTKKPELTF